MSLIKARQRLHSCQSFFFFNDTATTEIYTLSLHDALPICAIRQALEVILGCFRIAHLGDDLTLAGEHQPAVNYIDQVWRVRDRKSTRLNSSHANISYAVFCLKKKTSYSRNDENQSLILQ